MRMTLTGHLPTAAAFLLIGSLGCSYVGRDDFDTTIADVRSDMTAQDQRISANESNVSQLQLDVESLRQAIDELRQEFEVTVTELENGIRFATPVHFEFDSAEIRAADTALLDRFASVVKKYYDGATVTVEGFADPAGSQAYNKTLSEKRAGAVADYLTSTGGLDAGAVRSVGYGESRLVVPGAAGPGEEGWENRRVAFVVEYAS